MQSIKTSSVLARIIPSSTERARIAPNVGGVVTCCLLCLVLVSTGCAGRGAGSLEGEVDDLRELQVTRDIRIDKLMKDLQELRGRVEELEHERDGEVNSLKTALNTLQKRMPPPPVVPKAALEKALSSADALPAGVAGTVKAALEQVRGGAFEKAIELFNSVLDLEEGGRYVPEVLFWMAVAHDGLEQNRPALLAYHKIITEYADSALVPAALLRQAQVFERMQDTEAARGVLNKLLESYPRTKEAETARALLGTQGSEFR